MTEEIKVIPTNGTSADDVKYAKRVEAIYIDGVNVAECNFRLERDCKQKCECCHATGFGVICDCEAWHNCYYKQLKRLEQENKALQAYKDINEDFKKAWDELNGKYKQLLSALEEIKEALGEKYGMADIIKIRNILDEVLND